jgi:hypothetical protein
MLPAVLDVRERRKALALICPRYHEATESTLITRPLAGVGRPHQLQHCVGSSDKQQRLLKQTNTSCGWHGPTPMQPQVPAGHEQVDGHCAAVVHWPL